MECEQVRDQLVTLLQAHEADRWPEPVARHLEGCESCRAELRAVSRSWALLGRWPEASPPEAVRPRLIRRARRQLLRQSVLTVSGWTPAVLAAVIGVALSLGLSLLVPYSFLVSLCRQALQVGDSHPAAFLLAGAAYGLPLALGGWLIRRRTPIGAVVGSLEASLLFLLILAPYVVVQCSEFAPSLQVAFVSGLAGGAALSSLAGFGLARLRPLGRSRA